MLPTAHLRFNVSFSISVCKSSYCANCDKSTKFSGKSTQGVRFIFRCAAIANLTFEGQKGTKFEFTQ